MITPRPTRALVLSASLCLGLAVLAGLQAKALLALRPADEAAVQEPAPPLPPPAAMPPAALASFQAILDLPPFSRDRGRAQPVATQAELAESDEPPQPVAIVVAPGRSLVLVRGEAEGDLLQAGPGEEVLGWMIEDITPSDVTMIDRDGRTRTVTILQDGGEETSVSGSAATNDPTFVEPDTPDLENPDDDVGRSEDDDEQRARPPVWTPESLKQLVIDLAGDGPR